MARRRRVPTQRRTPRSPGPSRLPDPAELSAPVASSGQDVPVSKYAHLPAPVRREVIRTSQDVLAHADEVGEADRERAWLLRTTGLFL